MLKLSGDRKVSPLIRRQGSKDSVQVLNSFGLPAGTSCPGMTPFCESCYAKGSETAFPSAARLVAHNLAELQSANTVIGMTDLLQEMLATFRRQALKKGAALRFRIHWDGDFYSLPYAQAWRQTILENPDIRFWAYTRTFQPDLNIVPVLRGLKNLALYLSVDQWNEARAKVVKRTDPWVLLAGCSETFSESPVSGPKCPENAKRIPLVMALDGRRTTPVLVGDDAQGACNACGLCIEGRGNVQFAVKKR